jgi:hypothetical protein
VPKFNQPESGVKNFYVLDETSFRRWTFTGITCSWETSRALSLATSRI